ncbi:MAG TPA: serine hydrolase domain-containing protein [Gemmatimonadales bacterium]|nr:serine hydrolase domain-containing protein [Gemmatimonadales bacterium]
MITSALLVLLAQTQAPQVPDLTGLWTASLRFGPDVRGTLLVMRTSDGWRADISGYSVTSQTLSFELPDKQGNFNGKTVGREIHGYWIQPRTNYNGGRYATPVTLVPDGAGRWRGTVTPWDDRFTMYFPLTATSPGKYNTHLRNPDRNLGRFFRVSRVEVHRDTVQFIGNQGDGERVLTHGIYDEGGIWGVRLRGGAYDFARVPDTTASGYYPRGRPAARYRYAAPLQLDDGWPVGSVDDVGISRDSIERLVQLLIDLPMDSLSSVQVHSLLIARHGKLVVEEYFHVYDRDLPHELRSASKTMLSVLIGAANTAGIRISLDAPVYQTMLGTPPADLDPRKRTMTLEHLLSMNAGFECDPDSAAPRTADEDVMGQNRVQDYYRYTLNVPLNAAPGEKVYYCSAEPNLAGGMVEKITRQPQLELFDRLLGRPLQLRRYHLGLQPSGEVYGGGGHLFTSRDFLKFAQLMLDGRWGGEQILSQDWVQRSRAPLLDLSPSQQYRLLWNSREYDHAGRKTRAYFLAGNGGQVSVAFPELDLVIVLTGANYSSPATPMWRRIYGFQDILAAVR